MRNIFLTIVTINLFACGIGTRNEKTIEPPTFLVNPELIEELFIVENHNQQVYPFKEVETQTVDLNNDGKTDKITLYIIDNWGDPGNFHKIRLELSGKEPFELSNYSGWVTFNENYSIPEDIEDKNQLSSNNILLLNATPTTKLILIFGWIYASGPGLMTIIDPANQKILFNKNWRLRDIIDSNSDGNLELLGSSIYDGPIELLDFGIPKIELKSKN
ncbi:MAG: hypothetical protein ACFHWX_00475 [Bacteroidota bacterium]